MTYNRTAKHRDEDDLSRAEDYLQKMWNSASERNKIRYKTFEKNHCQEIPDGMDGFVIHTPSCPSYQHSAISGSDCVNLTRGRYKVGM